MRREREVCEESLCRRFSRPPSSSVGPCPSKPIRLLIGGY